MVGVCLNSMARRLSTASKPAMPSGELGGFLDLEGLGCVDDVVRREAVVQPARLGVETLGFERLCDCRRKGNDVVLDLGFDFGTRAAETVALVAMALAAAAGMTPSSAKHGAGRRFHLEPAAVLVLVRPECAHRRARVAIDQRRTPCAANSCGLGFLFNCTRGRRLFARNSKADAEFVDEQAAAGLVGLEPFAIDDQLRNGALADTA